MDLIEIVSQNLWLARTEKNLSLDTLANIINSRRQKNDRKITRSMLWEYENGGNIRVYNFFAICQALDVSPDEVIRKNMNCDTPFGKQDFPLERSTFLSVLSRKLITLKAKENLSLTELSVRFIDHTGEYSPEISTLSKYCKSGRDMPLKTLFYFAQIFDLTLIDFFEN